MEITPVITDLFYPGTGITEEKSANNAVTAVDVSTTGNPIAEGLVPTSLTCVERNQSCLAAPNEWSHGAHWYRSSAVLLRYHK